MMSIRSALYCQELVGIDLVRMIKESLDNFHEIVLQMCERKLSILGKIKEQRMA